MKRITLVQIHCEETDVVVDVDIENDDDGMVEVRQVHEDDHLTLRDADQRRWLFNQKISYCQILPLDITYDIRNNGRELHFTEGRTTHIVHVVQLDLSTGEHDITLTYGRARYNLRYRVEPVPEYGGQPIYYPNITPGDLIPVGQTMLPCDGSIPRFIFETGPHKKGDEGGYCWMLQNPKFCELAQKVVSFHGKIEVLPHDKPRGGCWQLNVRTIRLGSERSGMERGTLLLFETCNAWVFRKVLGELIWGYEEFLMTALPDKQPDDERVHYLAKMMELLEISSLKLAHEIAVYGVQHHGWSTEMDKAKLHKKRQDGSLDEQDILETQEMMGHTENYRKRLRALYVQVAQNNTKESVQDWNDEKMLYLFK